MVDGVHPLTSKVGSLVLQTIIVILYILPLGIPHKFNHFSAPLGNNHVWLCLIQTLLTNLGFQPFSLWGQNKKDVLDIIV